MNIRVNSIPICFSVKPLCNSVFFVLNSCYPSSGAVVSSSGKRKSPSLAERSNKPIHYR